jgi:hypothetical protein
MPKNDRSLIFLIFPTLFALLFSGCVLSMPEPLLSERNLGKGVIPSLSGNWKDDKGASIVISPTRFNNTFVAMASSNKESEIKATFERIDEGHFIMQIQSEDSKGVFLTLAQVTENRINVYIYPKGLEELRKRGEKNGITITEDGLIVKYESSKGVADFFRGLDRIPDHEYIVITRS